MTALNAVDVFCEDMVDEKRFDGEGNEAEGMAGVVVREFAG